MFGPNVEKINLSSEAERREVNSFLEGFGLILDKDVDYTLVMRDEQENIKATCSKAGNVFKCFAVSEDLRGENVTSTLITRLIDKMFEQGIYHSFLFTKPDKSKIFESLNFRKVCQVEKAVLLEYGITNISKQIGKLMNNNHLDSSVEKGAIVMNCNPFTLGHRYLVEKAASMCEQVLLFVVEEDKSLFPFKTRLKLVQEGVKDLKNVKVLPGTEYIISSATFPSYFIRKSDDRTRAYQTMDCSIFGQYFCKDMNITKRFVGDEPYCNVTNSYNETMKEVLPAYGVQVVEIERKKNDDEFISASRVREFIRNGELAGVRELVPESTWEFLNSKEGQVIVEKIKNTNSPH